MSQEINTYDQLLKNSLKDFNNEERYNNIQETLGSKLGKYESIIDSINEKIEKLHDKMASDSKKIEKILDLVRFKESTEDLMIIYKERIGCLQADVNNLSSKYDKIILQILEVPGIIGELCKFKSLRDFIEVD